MPGRIGRRHACSSHSLQDVVQLPLLHSSEPPSCLPRPLLSSGKDRGSQVSCTSPRTQSGGGSEGADAPHRLQSTLLPAEAPCSEFFPKLRLPRSTTAPQAPEDAHVMMQQLTYSSPQALLPATETSAWSLRWREPCNLISWLHDLGQAGPNGPGGRKGREVRLRTEGSAVSHSGP